MANEKKAEKVTWDLRYRSPLAPTRGVDDVQIQTNSRDELRAREVAKHWLGKAMPSPATVLVYVRPAVVQTEDDMIAELEAAERGVDLAEPTQTDSRTPATSMGRERIGQ